jgi:uncharacterized protein YuzE
MKRDIYFIRSTKPPVVEIDTEVRAAYVRFSNNRVVCTKEVPNADTSAIITIDLDEKQNVVGVELIGVTRFEIKVLLQRVPVTVVGGVLRMLNSQTGPEANAECQAPSQKSRQKVPKLSVTFVEWLMGYPEGWTALKDSETQSCRRSRSKSSKKSGGCSE